ncbi:hypothetical protein AAFP35_03510 [Gordonia sp. CPCC 206044]|uniref:hypothetical protein n=1 Tax=Gordonia sp. CPCC 206044 TaxID=3140793 RepID=UPI003AF33ABF
MAIIDDLIELVPPPAEPPTFDFEACEHALGVPLPDDYRNLVATYGLGEFDDDLMVWVPPHPEVEADNTITSMSGAARDALIQLRPTIPDTATWLLPDGTEHQVELGSENPPPFIGWGRSNGGMYGFWHIIGDDPNAWPVVYTDLGGAWDYDPRGLLEFVFAKVSGLYPDSRTGNYDPQDPYFSSFF